MKNQNGKPGNVGRASGIKRVLFVVSKYLNTHLLAVKHHAIKTPVASLVERHLSDSEMTKLSQQVTLNNGRAYALSEPYTLTCRQWIMTLNYFGWACAYCGGDFHVLEHFYPLGMGKGTTATNCVPSCHACNTRKSNRTPYDNTIPTQNLARVVYYFGFVSCHYEQVEPIYYSVGAIWENKVYKIERAGKV